MSPEEIQTLVSHPIETAILGAPGVEDTPVEGFELTGA
jgi:hypothetical protein